MLLIICSKKFGRDKALCFAIKVMSPIFIIIFYLSGVSIIVPILTKLGIEESIVNTSDSIRVAIDSAIVTLFINTILVFFNSPIKVDIKPRYRRDLEQVITYCDKPAKVDYSIRVNFRYKWVKRFYRKYCNPRIHIVNSKNTSIVIDRLEEYSNVINCDNSSQYISIDLAKISNSDDIVDTLYFTLNIQSDKSIKWDDRICAKIFIGKKGTAWIHQLFWQVNTEQLKLVHREENNA